MRDLRNEMYSKNESSSADIIHNDEINEHIKLEELEARIKNLERDVALLKGRHTTLR